MPPDVTSIPAAAGPDSPASAWPDLRASAQARSRADLLADLISERIRADGLGPGAAVGTLEVLREQTGYARATVSEGVRLLRDRGVLEIRPGRGGGLFVAASTPVVRLRRTLLGIQEQPTAVMDAIELREHLELMIDLSAARCRSKTDVLDLRRHLAQLAAAATWPRFMAANWTLHERIAAICPNEMARAVYIGTLGHLTSSTTHEVVGDPAAQAAYQRERYDVHAELVEAIAIADEEAVREAVRRHHVAS